MTLGKLTPKPRKDYNSGPHWAKADNGESDSRRWLKLLFNAVDSRSGEEMPFACVAVRLGTALP